MATTISVSEETRRRLMRLKLEENARSLDEVLERMIVQHRLARLREAQRIVQTAMAERGLTVDDLLGEDPDA